VPAIAIAVPMAFGPANEATPVVVAEVAVTADLLARLSAVQDFDDIRFTAARPDGNRAIFPIVDRAGTTLGHVSFDPFTPGADVLRTVAPIVAAVLLLGAVLTFGLLVRWRRASGRAMLS